MLVESQNGLAHDEGPAHEALESALVTVLSTVPPVEARNWFTPWGYTVQETENRSRKKAQAGAGCCVTTQPAFHGCQRYGPRWASRAIAPP
jgi:hypothetical protein